MGLFSSKKKIYVSSVAYNLGGPIEDRPNFLRSVVLQGVLSESRSLGSDIVGQHITGPGIKQRSFYRWSKTNYPLGTCEAQVFQAAPVDPLLVGAAIPAAPDETLVVNAAFMDTGDIVYWAEQWLLENLPGEFDSAWVADFDELSSELVISYPVAPETRVAMPGFDRKAKHVFAYYTLTSPGLGQMKRLFIYRLGAGEPVLDALESAATIIPEIFPIIPLRLDNKPISHEDFEADFPSHKRAYLKAVGTRIEDILESIEDNESIADIDFAFLVHGVELNTVEPIGQRYIFEFLRRLIQDQRTSPTDLSNWLLAMLGYSDTLEARAAWEAAQLDPLDPLYGTPEPSVTSREDLVLTRFEIKTQSALPYEAHIGWVTIDEAVLPGLGKPEAKEGDVWFEVLEDLDIPDVPFVVVDPEGSVASGSLTRFKAYRQESPDAYRQLTIYGMYHENFVYEGKSVYTTSTEALEEADATGFIFPLHYPSLLEMSLIDSTQLSISNKLIVFNCYKVVKQRWYQSGIFGLVFAIVLSVVVFPAGVGVLGANLAVGSALGLTGTSALIVGAVANAIAAIVLVSVIEKASVAILGEKLGAIVGVIAGVLAVNFATAFMGGGSFVMNFSEMIKAENLLKLTNTVSKIVTKFAEYEVGRLQEKYETARDEYNSASHEIEKKRLELLGYGAAVLDPLVFIGTDDSGSYGPTLEPAQVESSSTFLARSLLTGSDIVEISLSMVSAFSEISLDPPKAIV